MSPRKFVSLIALCLAPALVGCPGDSGEEQQVLTRTQSKEDRDADAIRAAVDAAREGVSEDNAQKELESLKAEIEAHLESPPTDDA